MPYAFAFFSQTAFGNYGSLLICIAATRCDSFEHYACRKRVEWDDCEYVSPRNLPVYRRGYKRSNDIKIRAIVPALQLRAYIELRVIDLFAQNIF